MIEIYSLEQMKMIRNQKRIEQQKEAADSGISTAVVCGQIVTIGDYDCDYHSWKHFIVAQIVRLGFQRYVSLTGWDINELVDDLAGNADPNDDIWLDDAKDYFNAVEANYQKCDSYDKQNKQ